jgi:hypothetical protein
MRNLQYRPGSTEYLFSKAAPVSEDAPARKALARALDAATFYPVAARTGQIANLLLNVATSSSAARFRQLFKDDSARIP